MIAKDNLMGRLIIPIMTEEDFMVNEPQPI